MAVLMDMEHWPAMPLTQYTIDQGHVKNPQRTHYLNATQVTATNLAGVGPDGVYRDPWGNPYVITIDLNYDGKARDAFYRLKAVSQQIRHWRLQRADQRTYAAESAQRQQ